ncbi:MAG: hypothetical protein HQ481_03185 [Alphaproteobacteria bacterium]|nr:hypothetical protein [Alphaproteobacteria bacterium]
MADDAFEMSVRKFLKQLGVTGHQEMEAAIRAARASGALDGKTTIKARAVVTLEGTGLNHQVEADIVLPSSEG